MHKARLHDALFSRCADAAMKYQDRLSTLALSFAVVGYLYYGIVHVPEDMDARDDVMWLYGKRKLSRAIVRAH